MQLSDIVRDATAFCGPTWPLDRAVAVNPFTAIVDRPFESVITEMSQRFGAPLWPSEAHLREGQRRGLVIDAVDVPHVGSRLETVAERRLGQRARRGGFIVGATLLEAVSLDEPGDVASRIVSSLHTRSGWSGASRTLRRRVAELFVAADDVLLAPITAWGDEGIREEVSRHAARLPGWMAWATWCDEWKRVHHAAALSRETVIRLSLAVDLALLEQEGGDVGSAPTPPRREECDLASLRALEDGVYADMLTRLSRPAIAATVPELQVVTCIDVRSEVLRRALEVDPAVETLGFAGFFGITAVVQAHGASETREALPVLVAPTLTIEGGVEPTTLRRESLASAGVLADLTHEPEAMFALAESTGWVLAPWLLGSVVAPRLRREVSGDGGEWRLVDGDRVGVAESALRGMGLTSVFAPDVVLLGHRGVTVANTHAATLQCGACAGHAGAPNAAALAEILNDSTVRLELHDRGISIPAATTFWSGEHNTSTDAIELHGDVPSSVRRRCEEASQRTAREVDAGWRDSVGVRRRPREVRTRDVSELRPEWGLSNHVAFVVGPRSSLRGVDLGGHAFMHSYDVDGDTSGSILSFILSAPMVVGNWINATYYFSSVAPDVFGAGDKTLLNPVGDFGVLSGDWPDLRLGLPWQSVGVGDRPYHLPVRLLVAVEAPRERIEAAVRANDTVRHLVENGWVRLVGRETPTSPWCEWVRGEGLVGAAFEREVVSC